MTDDEPFTLWREDLRPWLEREQVALSPGAARPCSDPTWRDAIVVLEYGSAVLTGAGGHQVRLTEGAVFSLAGLDRATLHNPGATTAVLSVGRRAPDDRAAREAGPRAPQTWSRPTGQRSMPPAARPLHRRLGR